MMHLTYRILRKQDNLGGMDFMFIQIIGVGKLKEKISDAGHSGICQAARSVHQVSDDRGRRRKGARYPERS